MKFTDKLAGACRANRTLLCIGLDPDESLIPPGLSILEFNKGIIEATRDLVCAYKPNFAFYEVGGRQGLDSLVKTIALIPPSIPVIGDAKRGDIGNTARAYARALFETLGLDAATVNPYLGGDSVEPFLSYTEKCVFLLCRTSNPGAADFQDLKLAGGLPLYEAVAVKAREWNIHGNIGLVAGATRPEELGRIRTLCPDMPLLIPGIGAQGGDLEQALRHGLDPGGVMTILNVSRQVLYASRGGDWAEAARKAAEELRNRIAALVACRSSRPGTANPT